MSDLIERKEAIEAIKKYGKDAVSAGRKHLDPVDDIIELCNMVEQLPAALHRDEPEMRPLTLAEVLELGKDDDSIVYIETRRFGGRGWCQPCAIIFDSSAEGQKNEIHFYEPGNGLPEFWPEAEYGKSWRCWPRKPTPEQMVAAKWEDKI